MNWLYTSLSGYFVWSVFPLLLWASPGHLSMFFFFINALGFHDLNCTYSLASLQWSGLSEQQSLLLTENCLWNQKWSPWKGRGLVSTPVCAKKERDGPACADQGLSIASQDSRHIHGMPWMCPPTTPIPPFLLAQNLSSKQIAPTDNIRPKLHDEYTRHQLLKG